MCATLGAGTARHTLVAADLNVPDGDGGADGLHAAVPQTGNPVAAGSLAGSFTFTAEAGRGGAVRAGNRALGTSVAVLADNADLGVAQGSRGAVQRLLDQLFLNLAFAGEQVAQRFTAPGNSLPDVWRMSGAVGGESDEWLGSPAEMEPGWWLDNDALFDGVKPGRTDTPTDLPPGGEDGPSSTDRAILDGLFGGPDEG
jgi:hypothetical protein